MKGTILLTLVAIIAILGYYFGKRYYLKPGIEQGGKASDFEAQRMDGSSFRLSDEKGKYILLDFWGSWCGPCRKEHPQLVRVYREFNNASFKGADGFDIVSIGMDGNAANWKKAIDSDSLTWPNQILQQAMFESPIAQAYTVRQLPTRFLIDPKGILIAVDPSLDRVETILRDRMLKPENQ
ncbi:MAG: TlpA family protein disulfide reductase [Bacteroidota bacterium]|nr:TlpA family protein disulfide reductase [Bacteroidota bacterium]